MVAAIRKGLAKPIGSLTQMGTVRLGKRTDGRSPKISEVVPLAELEEAYVAWARKMITRSPLALRMLKSSFNAELDGQTGIQELAGNATLLYYLTEEAKEGRNAFIEKRDPDWDKFPKFP